MFLIEMTRGCARGCRFCLAGYTSLPVRHRHVDHLMEGIQHGMQLRKRIGLISAATSDHPQLEQLLARMLAAGANVSLSSLRIDRISPFLVEALVRSGTRTITLAPEAGSQRMRDVINKRLTHEQIVQAAELAGRGGIPKVEAVLHRRTAGRDRRRRARARRALGGDPGARMREHNRCARVAVNLSPHVPKAQTAFQWEPMADVETSTQRIKLVQRALGPLGHRRALRGARLAAGAGHSGSRRSTHRAGAARNARGCSSSKPTSDGTGWTRTSTSARWTRTGSCRGRWCRRACPSGT